MRLMSISLASTPTGRPVSADVSRVICGSDKDCMSAAGDKFALLDEDEEPLTHLGRSLADDDFKAVRLLRLECPRHSGNHMVECLTCFMAGTSAWFLFWHAAKSYCEEIGTGLLCLALSRL